MFEDLSEHEKRSSACRGYVSLTNTDIFNTNCLIKRVLLYRCSLKEVVRQGNCTPGYWSRRGSRKNAGERKRDDGTTLLFICKPSKIKFQAYKKLLLGKE